MKNPYMLKVLVVDDEIKVARLVENLIDWGKLGLSLAGIVQDGLSAYRIICETKPDIVITDIRMPSMSGLDLIQKVVESGLHVHFIVISGYQYFEYAQKAIKYGVEDYLLKPINETELNTILKKIADQELLKNSALQRIDAMEKKINNSKTALYKEIFTQIEKNHLSDSIQVVNEQFGLNLVEGIFLAFAVKLDRIPLTERNDKQRNLIEKKILQIIEETIGSKVSEILYSDQGYGLLSVIINYPTEMKDLIADTLDTLFLHLREYVYNFQSYTLTMGIGRETKHFSDLKSLVPDVYEVIDWRIWKGAGTELRFVDMPDYSDLTAQQVMDLRTSEYKNALEIYNVPATDQIICKCFRSTKENFARPHQYYQLAVLLFTYYRKCTVSSDAEKKLSDTWLDGLYNCFSVQDLQHYVITEITNDLKNTLEAKRSLERKPVLKAIEYLNKNFGEKVTLDDIAKDSGFNPHYFSELFKTETGKNFMTYLTEIRMEEAKKLLRNSRDTIYQIASQVGYKDSKFFSQQFCRVVGINPREYRKLYR